MTSSLAIRNAILGLFVLAGGSLASGAGEQARRERLLERLEKARTAALERIFDEATYRDADHGRSAQKDVDAAVDGVRACYPPVRALLDGDAAKLEKQPARREALCAADPARLSAWERALRQHCLDRQVLAANEATPRQPLGAAPSPAEREQVRHTNAYRLVMGRPALLIDGRLVDSARGHSQEMRRLGYFAHESPTDGLRTVQERVTRAGLERVAVGENIAQGYRSAQAAFEGWYRSAGHHRNMLRPGWTRMGTGADGDLWTQNFASLR